MNIEEFKTLMADQLTHHFYHNGETTDVIPMRIDANLRARDNRHPENSIIHHHGNRIACNLLDHTHELYKVNQGLVE